MAHNHASKRLRMALDLCPEDFQQLGAAIMGQSTNRSETSFDRSFLEFFGVDPDVCARVWVELGIDPDAHEEDKGLEPQHLLWGLLWLKDYSTEGKLCKLVSTNNHAVDPKDFRLKTQNIVERIADLHPDVVSQSGLLRCIC